MRFHWLLFFILVSFPFSLIARAEGESPGIPTTWIDKDTGHRIWRLSDEPNSGSLYFDLNAYTPDSKQMVYTAPDGIHVLDLETRKAKLLVPNLQGERVNLIGVGQKTNSVFITRSTKMVNRSPGVTSVYKVDTGTGKSIKLVDLPPKTQITTVNADETLGAGTYIEGESNDKDYETNAEPVSSHGPNYQPTKKAKAMAERLAARLPLVLFTIRLEPGPNGEAVGTMKPLLHSTDWVSHLLFSPTDPTLLMYCHEGPWQKVDRIWIIHTDGTQNTLIHKRTMRMEVAGHEFWGLDGQTIWYDWQYPKAENFFLAGYNLKTGERTAFLLDRDQWSIHFNLTKDLDLFAGDGSDLGQVARAKDGKWIELFHPRKIPADEGVQNAHEYWQQSSFKSEHLVNMSHHYYRSEPNVRFTPDKKLVIFTSNMFGPSYVFGVEVSKSHHYPPEDVHSTPELARKFNPTDPPLSNK